MSYGWTDDFPARKTYDRRAAEALERIAKAAEALLAIATETRRAETTGSVEDEGAGPEDIAQ